MKIYFASDFHLGYPDFHRSLSREKKIIRWLDEIKKDAEEIYLLGDIFDFWYEYKKVVPRGFTRFLGKIAEITDSGIKVHFFTGNHDIWIYDYLPQEIGIILHRKAKTMIIGNKKFYIAHGDGLGGFDWKYNILKKIFTNKILQFLFSRLHPNFALFLGQKWSLSRDTKIVKKDGYLGDDKEFLVLHSKEIQKKEEHNFFIYGHRHFPKKIKISKNSEYFNTGDWISHFSYCVFDGEKMKIKNFE